MAGIRYYFLVGFFLLMFLAVFDAITKAYGITLFQVNMVETIIQFLYLLGSGVLAIINFIGDLLDGEFNIDGLVAIAFKLAGWLGFTITAILADIIKLPFRIIDLVVGSWVFGGIDGKVPTIKQINAESKNRLLLWLGIDFKNAIFSGGFGFRLYNVIYNPIRELGILFLQDDRLFFYVELDIGELGISLKGFVFGEVNVGFKLLTILKDTLKGLADSIGDWKTIYDKLIRNEPIF